MLLRLHHREDVFFAHKEDGVLRGPFAELVAGPGGEQDGVALLDLEPAASAVLEKLARADREDLALLGFVLGGVGQQDAPRRLLLGLESSHHNAVTQWLYFHRKLLDPETVFRRSPSKFRARRRPQT